MRKMKKNKYLKIIMIFFIIYLLLTNHCVLATESELLGTLEDYAQQQAVSTNFVDKVDVILGVIQTVGSLLSVICLIILGVKYLIGSVEEKAQYKKTLIPYGVGAFMVLGISNLLHWIFVVVTETF